MIHVSDLMNINSMTKC